MIYSYIAFEPGRHQICNPLDSFDLRCDSVTYVHKAQLVKQKLAT